MHLLVIVSILPDGNPSTGYEIANQAILEAYRRQGVQLTLMGFRRPGASVPEGAICLGDLAIENAGASSFRKAAWVAGALRRKLPVTAAKVARLTHSELLTVIKAAGRIDGIVFSSIAMAAAYPFLFSEYPCIFVAHNVENRSAIENADNAHSAIDRVLYRREAQLLERAEAHACEWARVVHTLAEDDKIGLGIARDDRAINLPLVVGRRSVKDDGRRTHDIGLIGTWSWAPNRVGLDWFLNEVVPLVPLDFEIAIAGRFDGTVPRHAGNVRFLGRVESAQDFVHGSRVLALATKAGTGIQLKTLETFEEGMPAVATGQALRGVSYLPSNVRKADRAGDFANALIDLVDKERSGRIGRLDGAVFAGTQLARLDEAVAAGLARLRTAQIRPGDFRAYAADLKASA
ncbi:glycosyltransferase family 4 protein [Fulvimarina sp. 2208YS6-2-32]|uniref:Glycosyltransferase family 4 protein n=1 Tax=Fulvimarina uroteuthidis TaxID=3098149 RepID=A0ABU5HZD8_9HYPH|nr:glycosyltransferase family 4 protein [Fulvimarina sp. 2208YS6-2-32]MDY8107949.1 glycosyltransferase family 4 protein [Fulvimarina sp. 2208YS6-2-32]